MGILLLILVIIDEFVCHLWMSDHVGGLHSWKVELGLTEGELSSTELAAAVLTQPAFFIHLLRHSFTYRCLGCCVWIIAMLMHGIYIHSGVRRPRLGGSKKRRASTTTVKDSNGNSVNGHGGTSSPTETRKVTFASEEMASTNVALVQNARPATKKRLRLFFSIALVLALCGIAFECYIAFANPGSIRPPVASTVATTINNTFESVLHVFSWSAFFYVTTRLLMLGLWCAFTSYCCWFLWYRKAVGTRRSKKGAAGATRLHAYARDMSGGGGSESEASDHDYDGDESEDDELSAAKDAGADVVSKMPVALVTPPAADSTGSTRSSVHDSSASSSSSSVMSDEFDSSELTDFSESESESEFDGATSFPIPSAAQLLLYEKLDASMFFHPEQEQNQYQRQVPKDITASTGHASATNSPSHAIKQQQLFQQRQQRKSFIARPASSITGSPLLPPLSPATPTAARSHSIHSTPVSSSSPMLHSTLYHLASTKFLANLSPTDFSNILPEVEWQHIQQGEIIFRKGDTLKSSDSHVTGIVQAPTRDPTDGMHIVASGSLGVLQKSDQPGQPPHVLMTYHQGDSIGELEFLFNTPRAFTLVALTPVQLLRIPTRLGRLWRLNSSTSTSTTPSAATTPMLQSQRDASLDLSVPASATTLESSPTYAAVHELSQFSHGVRSMLADQQPRSDILLSFIRTTLARQWRSAEFILEQFLHLPLTPRDYEPFLPTTSSNNDTQVVTDARSRYWTAEFANFFSPSSDFFRALQLRTSNQLELSANGLLFEEGNYRSDQLFIVLEGSVVISSRRVGETTSVAGLEVGPGGVLNAVSYFTDTVHSHTVRGSSVGLARVAWLNRSNLMAPDSDILRLALTVCSVLAPTLAQFQAIGFERKWIRAGTLVFKESQACDALHVITSGRVRIATGKLRKVRNRANSNQRDHVAFGVHEDADLLFFVSLMFASLTLARPSQAQRFDLRSTRRFSFDSSRRR